MEVEVEENRYFINPHILLSVCNFSTILNTVLKVWTSRICIMVKSFLIVDHLL